MLRIIIGIVVLMLFPVKADAMLLFGNPLDQSQTSNFHNGDGYLSTPEYQVASEFSFSQDSILNSITWYGLLHHREVPEQDDIDFTVQIYKNDALAYSGPNRPLGRPVETPFYEYSGRPTIVDSGYNWDWIGVLPSPSVPWLAASTPIYAASLNLPDVVLNKDEIYWMSIFNDPSEQFSIVQGQGWSAWGKPWLRSPTRSRFAPGPGPESGPIYALYGDPVPEPATMLLFGAGFFGTFLRRRIR